MWCASEEREALTTFDTRGEAKKEMTDHERGWNERGWNSETSCGAERVRGGASAGGDGGITSADVRAPPPRRLPPPPPPPPPTRAMAATRRRGERRRRRGDAERHRAAARAHGSCSARRRRSGVDSARATPMATAKMLATRRLTPPQQKVRAHVHPERSLLSILCSLNSGVRSRWAARGCARTHTRGTPQCGSTQLVGR